MHSTNQSQVLSCLVLSLCSLGLGLRAQAQNVNLSPNLIAASNDYMSAADFALDSLLVVQEGRWRELYRFPTNWMVTGSAGIHFSDGIYILYANRLSDFYQTPPCFTSAYGAVTLAPDLIFRPYSNSLTIAIAGQPAGSNAVWSLTAYPAEFTNSSAFTTAGTNTTTLTPIPTGLYAVAISPSFRGRSSPASSNIAVLATRISTSRFDYVAYTNVLSVTAAGITTTTNTAWSLSAYPAPFTNAETYATAFSNVSLLTAIPTGSYTVAFPYVPGFITPDPIRSEVTAVAQTNGCTGTYVAVTWGPYTNATDTNPPSGSVPTNFPPATNPGTVMAWSNGVLATPTNLWTANAESIAAVAAAGGIDTSLDGLKDATNKLDAAVKEINARTSTWNTAATDASSATGAIVILRGATNSLDQAMKDVQAQTSTWNKAAVDGAAATAAVKVLESATGALHSAVKEMQARTSAWNTAAADGTAATAAVAAVESSITALQTATNNLNERVAELEKQPSATRTFLWTLLDLDPLGQGTYTDFEIKFSTNNFTNLVYWYRSWAENSSQHFGYPVDDPDPFVYFTVAGGHTDGNMDPRFWHKQTPHDAIFATLADSENGVVGGIEFWPSHSCDYPASWMTETNECLVGSWCRWTPLDFEKNAAGAQIWRPVEVHWATERKTR